MRYRCRIMSIESALQLRERGKDVPRLPDPSQASRQK